MKKIKFAIFVFVFIAAASVLIGSCGKDRDTSPPPPPPPPPGPVAGPLFINARSVIVANCATSGCHTGTSPQAGINFSQDAVIVANRDRIKARAIDGIPTPMPPNGLMSQTNRNIITTWINAGGRFTD